MLSFTLASMNISLRRPEELVVRAEFTLDEAAAISQLLRMPEDEDGLDPEVAKQAYDFVDTLRRLASPRRLND